MVLIGELSLWVALLMAIWAAGVSFVGARTRRDDLIVSGQRATYATFALILVASIGLWTALLTHDFSLSYVASNTSSNMDTVYVFAAFWGGQAGSMLFWCLILSMFGAVAVYTSRERNREMVPYVAATMASVLVFFIATTAFKANPFDRLPWTPLEGRGMNPQLQNPGMALHPPNLYLGYIGTTVPFAFAFAALFIRRLDNEWLAAVRRWSLISWFFLTIGIVLGMWWAYLELGWGGYWFWDPVENASFLPWLTQTAFLHSIMIQEKRGMLRKWNVVLVIATFLLSIFGTFITRSGIIESVHSFARSPVSNWFFTFFVLACASSVVLIAFRLRDVQERVELESMVSREAAFLYNNLVLCAIAFAVLWGTMFPVISEAVLGPEGKVTVGVGFFNPVNIPLGLLLLALTGIGPLIAWRKASLSNLRRQFTVPVLFGVVTGVVLVALRMRHEWALVTYVLCGFVTGTILQEFYKGIGARRSIHGENFLRAFAHLVARNRRRYGGYVVHAGIVMLFAAFAGLAFRKDHDDVLDAGEALVARDPLGHEWRFVSQGLSTSKHSNRVVESVSLDVTRDGKPVRMMKAERRQYIDAAGNSLEGKSTSTEVDVVTTALLDTYVFYTGPVGTGPDAAASIRVSFTPLVVWVWIGGALMAVGGLIVMWPQADKRRPQGGYVTTIRGAPRAEPAEAALVG